MTTPAAPAVFARNLTRRFGSLTAVGGVDLEIPAGEIFGLVGPDGAGKTTVLRLLCGLLEPSAGEVRIAGHDVQREPETVRDLVGYMPQRFGLYPDLTVEENMFFLADLFGIERAEAEASAARLLRMMRLEPFRRRAAGKLSGGMRQKLALMGTLLHRPRILLLDEPTTGVDPVSRRDFWAVLYQLVREGLTVVAATAYLDEAERCRRVALLHRGRVLCCKSPDTLRRGLPEVCYEAKSDDLGRVREILSSERDVLSAEPAGGCLHVLVAPGGAAPDALRRSLQRAGATASFRRIVPSLEDVFIAIIRRADEAPPAESSR